MSMTLNNLIPIMELLEELKQQKFKVISTEAHVYRKVLPSTSM